MARTMPPAQLLMSPEIIDVEEEDDMRTDEVDGPVAPDNSLELQIVNFIKKDTRLYEKILRYEAIDLAVLHTNLKLNNIKIKKKKIARNSRQQRSHQQLVTVVSKRHYKHRTALSAVRGHFATPIS